MTDALRLAVRFAFQYLGAVQVYTRLSVESIASCPVLEKNVFHLDGTLRSHILKRGKWRGCYSLFGHEWDAQEERYQPYSERVVTTKKSLWRH